MRGAVLLVLLHGCFVGPDALREALDRDGDGFLPVEAGGDDCDEARADVNPGAVELCGDGVDNDCDGWIDDHGLGSTAWYRDEDGDGYGTVETTFACTRPPGFAALPGDCDDGDPAINPAALDLCDGADQNCDGVPDDDAPIRVYYRDADGDGAGVFDDAVEACEAPPGYVLAWGDCDDGDETIRPGALDICDGVDQDCDGAIDEDAEHRSWYFDSDGDGLGDPDVFASTCDGPPPDHVSLAGDCDDADPSVQVPLWFFDVDGDGFGAGLGVAGCFPPPGHVARGDDCDDEKAWVSPGEAEVCNNGLDDDCDPETNCRWSGSVTIQGAPSMQLPAATLGSPGVRLIDDFIGSPHPDYILTTETDILLFEGPTPDFLGVPLRTFSMAGVAQSTVDLDGDDRAELVLFDSQGVYVHLSGSGADETISVAVPNCRRVVAASHPSEGPGLWLTVDTPNGSSQLLFHSWTGTHFESTPAVTILGQVGERFGSNVSTGRFSDLQAAIVVSSLPSSLTGRYSVFPSSPGVFDSLSDAVAVVDGFPQSLFTLALPLDADSDGEDDLVTLGMERGNGLQEGFVSVQYGPIATSDLGPLNTESVAFGIGGQRLAFDVVGDLDGDGNVDFIAVYEGADGPLPTLPVFYGPLGVNAPGDADAYITNPLGYAENFRGSAGSKDINMDGRSDFAIVVGVGTDRRLVVLEGTGQ